MKDIAAAMLVQSDAVLVKRSPGKGRGVFARRDIKKGELIERAPVLFIPAKSLVGGLENKALGSYYYYWDEKTLAVSLGYGSLYNHSYKPNARYRHEKRCLVYTALRTIEKGEEILINYNWKPDDMSKVNFIDVESGR